MAAALPSTPGSRQRSRQLRFVFNSGQCGMNAHGYDPPCFREADTETTTISEDATHIDDVSLHWLRLERMRVSQELFSRKNTHAIPQGIAHRTGFRSRSLPDSTRKDARRLSQVAFFASRAPLSARTSSRPSRPTTAIGADYVAFPVPLGTAPLRRRRSSPE